LSLRRVEDVTENIAVTNTLALSYLPPPSQTSGAADKMKTVQLQGFPPKFTGMELQGSFIYNPDAFCDSFHQVASQ